MKTKDRQALSEPVLFFWISLILHIPFLGLNLGTYTDGILQLRALEYKAGLYPPLYGALSTLIGMLPGCDPEIAGRFISTLAASALVFPLWSICLSLTADQRAARWTAILTMFLPLLFRWSLQTMSDTLCLFFITCCLAALGKVLTLLHDPVPDRVRIDKYLAGAMALSVITALTRYQGAMLLIPVALVFLAAWKALRTLPLRALLTAFLWTLLPLWMYFNGFSHAGQFSDRASLGLTVTLLAYLNIAESFIMLAPYYFCLPVVLLAVVGFFAGPRAQGKAGASIVWLWILWGAIILILQTLFLSFQYRYMLPILPIVLVFAGSGAAWLLSRADKLGIALVTIALFLMVAQTAATLIGQYQSFGDQKLAMRWIKNNVDQKTAVFGNERYGNFLSLGCPKWSYWSGRVIAPCWTPADAARIAPGSIVALSSAYGGIQSVAALRQAVTDRGRRLTLVEMFRSRVIPIFDDVMSNPTFNQNPMMWIMRYTPQDFDTYLFKVEAADEPTTR